MIVTMIKKRLNGGQPCAKCVQTEEMLKKRGLWHKIDHVLWAIEEDETSEGMILAQKYNVNNAPFFLVEHEGRVKVYDSGLRLAKFLKLAPDVANGFGADAIDVETAWENLAKLGEDDPQALISKALEMLGENCIIAFSGSYDAALIDMATKSQKAFSTLVLDTGRLHPETYEYIETVRKHFHIDIDVVSPQASQVESLVREKGLFSFYEDGHKECCSIRKVEPLRNKLKSFTAWITGQRRDQNPTTRGALPAVQWDSNFFQQNGSPLLKLNPLAAWDYSRLLAYVVENNVPSHPLHDSGYKSIGCAPCTRAVAENQQERQGRWWWESEEVKECGLHLKQTPKTNT